MAKKHLFYCDVMVKTPVIITVMAENEQEAFARLNDGAWHGVQPKPADWSQAKVTHIGEIKIGPGISPVRD